MGERIILHCDLNSFYASVELLDKPALWEVPVAVCGDPKTRHGIILAKNEPAKKYGIQTAETVWQAKKKCPGLVLLPPHHDLYKMWSVRVNDIYERFTDLIEPFGIDVAAVNRCLDLALAGGGEVPPTVRAHYDALDAHGSDCVACGQCEVRCPFHVSVPARMARAAALFGK